MEKRGHALGCTGIRWLHWHQLEQCIQRCLLPLQSTSCSGVVVVTSLAAAAAGAGSLTLQAIQGAAHAPVAHTSITNATATMKRAAAMVGRGLQADEAKSQH